MKRFNYEDLFIVSHGIPSRMLEAFKLTNLGPNFMVNQKALVDAFWLTDQHKAEYIGLCALRSYEDYISYGTTDLSVHQLPPWVPIEVVSDNPLVTITNNQIIFNKENI